MVGSSEVAFLLFGEGLVTERTVDFILLAGFFLPDP